MASQESNELVFTKAHGALVSGLVASGLGIKDCYHIVCEELIEFDKAREMFLWLYEYAEKQNHFPSREECLMKCREIKHCHI